MSGHKAALLCTRTNLLRERKLRDKKTREFIDFPSTYLVCSRSPKLPRKKTIMATRGALLSCS